MNNQNEPESLFLVELKYFQSFRNIAFMQSELN